MMTLSFDRRTFPRGSTVASGSAPDGDPYCTDHFCARAYRVWAASRPVGVFAYAVICHNGSATPVAALAATQKRE
jgi:hypothetical protein